MNIFYDKIQSYIDKLDIKKRDKYTINNQTYKMILSVLNGEDIDVSAKFRFWTRKTFICMRIGSNDFVYDKQTNLPLVKHENLYEKILECHVFVGHSGRDKTWAEVLFWNT